MKKIWSILLIGICLGMVSCSDDDKNELPDDILGEWSLQSMDVGVLNATDSNIEELAEDIFTELSKEYYFGDTVEFYEDGTGMYHGFAMDYSVRKNVITIVDEDGYKMDFSYSMVGSRLVLTIDVRKMIVEEMTDELDKEEIDYLKKALKEFTIDFTYK